MAKIIKNKIRKNLFFGVAVLFLVLPFVLISNKKNFSFSKGDIYFSRLNSWFSLAKKGDWQGAKNLESKLDPSDIQSFKIRFFPGELQKKFDRLLAKENKTVEDWMELAQIQISLGKKQEAQNSVLQAHKIDPVRTDIENIYFALTR